jgi:endoglucanase
MNKLLPFLKELISLPGLSGYEDPAAALIEQQWKPLVQEVRRSKLGSLHAFLPGRGPEPAGGEAEGDAARPRPSVMVCTHMDAIGLMVSRVVEGFLHVSAIGGVDGRVLPGQLVSVHATGGARPRDLPAVVAQPSTRLLPPEIGENPVPLEHLLVDTGLPPSQVTGRVRVGDLVSYASPPVELAGEAIAGHSLDNRASVAALTICLDELRTRPHAWDVWAVATVQEETGLAGAYTSAFGLRPNLALVLDVTWARGPGAADWSTYPLGKGPTIVMGPNVHPALFRALKELADRLEIPYAQEYTPRHSGTDAYATQVTAEGIPSAVLGIPLRYMHTPVEVVGLKDIQRAGRLLAEFIAGLGPDFMDSVGWED